MLKILLNYIQNVKSHSFLFITKNKVLLLGTAISYENCTCSAIYLSLQTIIFYKFSFLFSLFIYFTSILLLPVINNI